jgi:hypothetical protein
VVAVAADEGGCEVNEAGFVADGEEGEFWHGAAG